MVTFPANRFAYGLCSWFLAAAAYAQQNREADSASYAQVVRQVAPSVVTVVVEGDATRTKGFLGNAYGGAVRGAGSGVVMSERGLILTNYHVVKHALRIDVESLDGRIVRARLLGADPATDLAVIQCDDPTLKALHFADSGVAAAGDRVLAIGAPFGLRHTVTAGVVSAVERARAQQGVVVRYLQTDARIGPGNSGGPLVNMRGEVVGINTFYLREGSGFGFAIPSNLARDVFRQLVQSQVVTRGYLGIYAQSIDAALARFFKLDQARGALINRIDRGSPAARAGLKPSDIVTAYGGVTVSDASDLLERIATSPVDAQIGMRVLRAGANLEVALRVAKARPADEAAVDAASAPHGRDPMLGLKVQKLTPVLRQETGYRGEASVIVAGVEPGSPADRAGLHSGVAIVQADLRSVGAPRDLLEPLGDGTVLLLVEDNDGERSYILVKADE
jgi:serine protease Do